MVMRITMWPIPYIISLKLCKPCFFFFIIPLSLVGGGGGGVNHISCSCITIVNYFRRDMYDEDNEYVAVGVSEISCNVEHKVINY